MAETVKKSRIVSESDENLEESLLEEFNTRLKKCMSRDDLRQPEDDRQPSPQQHHVYENVQITRKEEEDSETADSSQRFLDNEREQYGSETVARTNGHVIGNHHHDQEITLEIDKIKPEPCTKPCEPSLSLPITCLVDASSPDCDSSEVDGSKSVKNRMFLSSDDAASCLLFTQTVTSPMLTPSEENIDFLKGFRRESSQNTLSDETNSSTSPKSNQQDGDAIVTGGSFKECADDDERPKDAEILTQEHIYENIEVMRNGGTTDDDEQEATETSNHLKEATLEFIRHEITCTHDRNVINDEEVGEERQITVCRNVEGVDVHDIPADSIKNLKTHFMSYEAATRGPLSSDTVATVDDNDMDLKSLNVMKQISKFESKTASEEISTNACTNFSVSTVTESRFVETTTESRGGSDNAEKALKKKKSKKSKNQHEKENISVCDTNHTNDEDEDDATFYNVNVKNLKSSFSKFDALQKKNGGVGSNEYEQANGADMCKACGRPVFQMERLVAARCLWHRNCFRCTECGKQLLLDNFEAHEGVLYCKPHFRALFAPKTVEDEEDSGRASDKPDLGLEELHSLNVKERFQVFENVKHDADNQPERNPVKMERSPSILSKLARFQAKGMDVGMTDDSLNGVPVELSDSDDEQQPEEDEDGADGEDADLIRAKRVQKEKPFHFVQMSDVKNRWERGNGQQNRDERREERKQEIQNIRSRLFHGKQGKMKEAYQQAIAESETKTSGAQKEVPVEASDTRSIKDKFERGELGSNELRNKETEDMTVFESGISKKSRSIFQELDASGGIPPKIVPSETPKLGNAVRNAREAYLAKQASEDTVRSSDQVDEVAVRTADIQDRFKFFETYREPQQTRREFRMTPPREGQMKSKTPERELNVNPDIVRSDDYVEDSVVAKATHTATKMLNKFRQMEENLQKGQDTELQGPMKPMKRFTPPREPIRQRESSSGSEDDEESGSEEEEESEEETRGPSNNRRMHEQDLLEAQKAARAKQLKAKFERWEETTTTTTTTTAETRRDSAVNLTEEIGDNESQTETARSLRAKFESLKENNNPRQSARVKVNRFVREGTTVTCESCGHKVYPMEQIRVHGYVFHRRCFRCKECNAVLRMDSYSYNRGLVYCTPHFKRLFITKGDYDTAFGLERHKDKWNVVTSVASH